MGNATIDSLFLKHLKAFTKGTCFLCNEKCDVEGILHSTCADSAYSAKQERLKQAWIEAQKEYDSYKKSKGESNED